MAWNVHSELSLRERERVRERERSALLVLARAGISSSGIPEQEVSRRTDGGRGGYRGRPRVNLHEVE